jgi:hypothetical protein
LAAAIIVPVEEIEQAAAMTAAARITTTSRLAAAAAMTAKEGRRITGAREHRGNAQDQRRQSKTNVHLRNSYMKQKREG